MTHSSSLRLAALAFAAALLTACASTYTQGTTPAKRIQENRALFESWPLSIQNAVMDRKIEKGMTQEMVVMALGKPTRVTPSFDQTGEELWVYGTEASDMNDGVGQTQMSLGTGPLIISGPIATGGGSSAASIDYQEITFKDGKVLKTL